MDAISSTLFPWKTLELSGQFMFISIILFFISAAGAYILANSKKIRYLYFVKNYTYILLFVGNIMFLFMFLWYDSLTLVLITTFVTYRSVKKGLIKIQEEELSGGWCCNKKCREQQIKAFKLKSPEEQEKELEYYINHPLKLNPVIVTVICVLIPIVITLCLWALGVGYNWHYNSFVQAIG